MPVPSHRPFVPQLVPPASVHWVAGVGAVAAGTGEQVPALPLTAHDMQVPVQALVQQTPCWQKPLAHSAAVVHAVPGVFSVQTPTLQMYGDTQSALAEQDDLQAVALPQVRFPEQGPAVTAWQTPAPLQVCAGVRVEPVQTAGAHWVPVG